jgi:hypothetical protein
LFCCKNVLFNTSWPKGNDRKQRKQTFVLLIGRRTTTEDKEKQFSVETRLIAYIVFFKKRRPPGEGENPVAFDLFQITQFL